MIKIEPKYTYKISKVLDIVEKVTYDNGDVEIDFNSEKGLIVLLSEEKVFLNAPWWKKDWPEEVRKTIAVHVNCSDIFAWGCADAEICNYDELEDLFNHFIKDNNYGTDVWCMKKRNLMPQKPVYDKIQEKGIWDLDDMELKYNKSWNIYKEKKV